MTDIVKSLGHHGIWGFSPTFDYLEALERSECIDYNTEEPIRILLLHPGDIRHILTTISRRRRHKNNNVHRRPIHFYIYETPMEIIARDLVLLELLNDYEVPIRQRANTFLELFGNSKVQLRTGRYLEQLGYQVQQLIATGKGRLQELMDFSLMKYRERDLLEECFKSYRRSIIFDVDNLRDHRLRGLYEERYDARKSLADWDWHYSLKTVASIIHVKLYKEWRLRGIAYEFGDQEYTEPNRTMMTFTEGLVKKGKAKGEHKDVKGLWTDVVVSPYIAFGIDCYCPGEHEEGLFEIQNKDTGTEQHRHHTAEVSVFNMLALLWEVETGEVYSMARKNDIYSGLGKVDTSVATTTAKPEEAEEEEEQEQDRENKKDMKEEEGMERKEGKVNEDDKKRDNDSSGKLPPPPSGKLPPPPPSEEEETALENETTLSGTSAKDTLDSTLPPSPPATSQPEVLTPFIAAPTYSGRKIGYVYKIDSTGLGYYIDELEMKKMNQGQVMSIVPSTSIPNGDMNGDPNGDMTTEIETDDNNDNINPTNAGQDEGILPDSEVEPEPEPEPEPLQVPPVTEVEMTNMLKRAENILESYDGVKIFPLTGPTGDMQATLGRTRFQKQFHSVYLSSRCVHALELPFMKEVLSTPALVVAESSKFLVPLTRDARKGYVEKINEFAEALMLEPLIDKKRPVDMRYRDERDTVDDKLFFRKNG